MVTVKNSNSSQTKYRIKPVEEYLAEHKAKQAQQTSSASTTPAQTVQIKNATGGYSTVTAGSQIHQNYLKNNPSAIDQSSVKTTYSTPDVYKYSDNVKTFDQNGQQTSSVSGYQGAITPSFNVTSDITNLVNTVKNQEAQMRNTWANGGGDYNQLIRDRNNQTGQLVNAIMQASGGNASLGEIESILGRRLENQELDAYRTQYSTGSSLQQSQLNNLFEHDFAARNNGENYQYNLNYLQNGTGGEVLGESKLNYLNSLSPDALSSYTTSQADSLASTQNYFTQRAEGYTPAYVNNTINPLPWGEVDAADVINNGGVKLQQQYEDYLWQLANPNYDYTNMQPSPLDTGSYPTTSYPTTSYPTTSYPTTQNYYTPTIPNFNFTLPETSFNPNINVNLSGLGGNQMQSPVLSSDSTMNPYSTTQSSYGATNNQTLVDKQTELLNKYLQDIFKGGV